MKKTLNSSMIPVSTLRLGAIQKLAVVTAGLSLFSLGHVKKTMTWQWCLKKINPFL